MKLFNTKNKMVFLLLVVVLTMCVIWSVRLEAKAAALQTRIDEHQKSLKANEDVLKGLKSFVRTVGAGGNVSFNMTQDGITLSKDGSKAYVGKLPGSWAGAKEGVAIGEIQAGTIAVARDKGIGLQTTNDKPVLIQVGKDFKVTLSPKDGQISIMKGDSKVYVGKLPSSWKGATEGVGLGEAQTGTIAVGKGKGIGIQTANDNPAFINTGKDFEIRLSPTDGQITIIKGDSKIYIGKLPTAWEGATEGIAIGEANTGTMAVAKGKGIGIQTKNGNKIIVREDSGDIDIKAKGDINITSTDGEVNIKGKKVNING